MTLENDTRLHLSYIRESLGRPVVLVGMMGSGKSRIGRKLAHSLGLDFYDTDKLVEARAGHSINEIFASYGEKKFRDAERSTIIALLDQKPCVIATGGGAVTGEGIPELFREKAVTIWLRADIQEILRRVKNTASRPLLQGTDPAEALENLRRQREPLYRRADITVETAQGSIDDTESRIIKGLYDFLKNSNLQAT